MAEDIKKDFDSLDDEELEQIVGGTNYPPDWDKVPLAEKRARMVMSARRRQLNQPCEFD